MERNITNRMLDPPLILKYIKSEQNVCDYSSRHAYKDLLKVKELTPYVNFVAYDATLNALAKGIIEKAIIIEKH